MRWLPLVLLVGCLAPLPEFDPDADHDGHTLRSGDCDDADAAVFPGADERCNGEDDDCDGEVDEDAVDQLEWYDDADGDGHGAAGSAYTACDGPSRLGDDCDDSAGDVHPGSSETCDGRDEDCDLSVDEGLPLETWWRDEDGDGYGGALESTESCSNPGAGWSSESTDCDDETPLVSPDASEACDALDNDCDGVVDEGYTLQTWWLDGDGDGFGGETSVAACASPGPSYVGVGGDCDDGDASVSPVAEEVCGDGVDQDCDGSSPSCAS